MKKAIVFFLLSHLISYTSNAQLTDTQVIDSVDAPSKYYFSAFEKGSVFMKNETQIDALLNYQMKEQAIAFEKDGQHLLLTNLDEISSVNIQGFRYVPLNGKFYEILLPSEKVSLLISYFAKVIPYGVTYDKKGVSNVSQDVLSNDVSNTYVNRLHKVNNELSFVNTFWLLKGQKIYKIKNLKSVQKIYTDKQVEIEKFVNENKTDFDQIESMTKLIEFCNR